MDQNKNYTHEAANQSIKDQAKDNLYRVDEIIDQPRYKSSAWKWLLFIVLLLGLVILVAYTPELNRYFPDLTPASSSSYQSSSSHSLSSQSNSDGIANTAAVYGGLTLAIPIMIGALTFMTFINMAMFASMSMNIASIRSMLEDVRFEQKQK